MPSSKKEIENEKYRCKNSNLSNLDSNTFLIPRRKLSMLGDKNSSANIAVKDLEFAKNFCENILGLKK